MPLLVEVAAHLAAHAPTPDAFAAGLSALASNPVEGLALAAHQRAEPAHVAAASERYGLSPAATATALADAGTPASVLVETIWHRCDHDTETTIATVGDTGRIATDDITTILDTIEQGPSALPLSTPGRDTGSIATGTFDLDDADTLLASLPDPVPTTAFDPARLEELAEQREIPGRHLSGAQP